MGRKANPTQHNSFCQKAMNMVGKPSSEGRKFPFTKKALAKLPIPSAGRQRYRDSTCPGLVLSVTPTSRVFYLYKKFNSKPVEYRIGPWPGLSIENARKAMKAAELIYATGGDPQAARKTKREEPILKELWEHYLDFHAKPRKRSWKADEWQWKKYFTPWHNRRLSAITQQAVERWHGKVATDSGPTQANRCLALLATMFSKAGRGIGYAGPNPCVGVAKHHEQSRERYLVPDEMKAFFTAVMQEEPLWRDFFCLLLLTGQRRGNVASMRWEEIDLSNAIWHIPADKAKANKPVTVAISPPALVIVRRRREEMRDGCPWVFPGPGVEGRVIEPKRAWQRILDNSGIQNLHMHDLRRSLASWQAALGASLSIIGKSLGHADLKSTQVYARLQLDPVRESVSKAGQAMLTAGGMIIDEK
jgi:integrase